MSQQPSGRGPRVTFEGTGTRQVRPTAVGRGTHGVPDVRRIVESQFHIAFPHRVWVSGEVGAPYGADDGLRFALHPSTGDDPFALPCLVPDEGLPAVRSLLARTHDADLEDVVREGRLARVGGLLRFEAARGSVVLLVSELDPTPTALELESAREAALQHVAQAGLAEHQRTRVVRTAPLEVAVVAAPDELERARALLASARYDVTLHAHPVVLTGVDAATVLAEAVRAAGAEGDVVLLLRRQGRPLGLATYDAVQVAAAVAECPVPVLTGLGGDGTRTAADEVAWAALPTAADALTWLVERLEDAEHALDGLAGEVAVEVQDAGERCRAALATLRAEVDEAAERAAARAADVRRRRRLALRLACALLAVAVVVAAVVTGRALLLLALLVPLLALVGAELWWRSPDDRRTRMSARDDDFTQVLTRLRAVRDELRTTTSPERVGVLRELAAGLAADGEKLLGVHLTPGAPEAAAGEPPSGDGGAGAAVEDAGATRAVPGAPQAVSRPDAAAGQSGGATATQPGPGQPAAPGDAGRTQPGDTGPTQPGDTGQTQPGDTGPTQPGDTGQTQPGDTGQTQAVDTGHDTGQTQPVDLERTGPGEPPRAREVEPAAPGDRRDPDDQDRTSVLLRPESPDRR